MDSPGDTPEPINRNCDHGKHRRESHGEIKVDPHTAHNLKFIFKSFHVHSQRSIAVSNYFKDYSQRIRYNETAAI